MKVAGAPISWGVCEVPGWGAQLQAERVLDEMVDVGLTATELGPDGFLPDQPAALKALLAPRGLRLVAAFVPLALHRREQRGAALAMAASVADQLAAAGAEVMVHDPLFTPAELGVLGAQVVDLDSPQAAAAEAVVVQAWHRDFRDLDWRRFEHLQAVLDGRGSVDPRGVRDAGASYVAIGG